MMARRAPGGVPRPRSERDIPTEIITYTRPDDPPRRLNGAGFVIVVCVLACAVFYVLGYVGASHWWHR